MHRRDALDDLVLADHLVVHPVSLGVEGHELDETDLDALGAPEVRQVEDLVVVHTALDDRVDLDAAETGGDGGIDALQHAHQLVASGHRLELRAIERVEADVHPTQTRGLQLVHAVRERRTVGGEGQVDGSTRER